MFEIGYSVYNAKCNFCHGGRLQGQWGWQQKSNPTLRLAPPLDGTARTWPLSDQSMYEALAIADATDSGHLAVAASLSPVEIRAVNTFIKAHWLPLRLAVQALRSGDLASFPWPWRRLDLRFPPDCFIHTLPPK